MIINPTSAEGMALVRDMAESGQNVVLTPEQEAMFQEWTKTLKSVKATYKVEIVFNSERSVFCAFPGLIYVMKSGGFASGGGDTITYLCPRVVAKRGEDRLCGGPVDVEWLHEAVAVCKRCKQPSKPADLIGQVGGRWTYQQWARCLVKFFQLLDCDADVVLTTFAHDLRRAAQAEQEKAHGGEKLSLARRAHRRVVYPLASIVRDVSSGSGLEARMRAFILA